MFCIKWGVNQPHTINGSDFMMIFWNTPKVINYARKWRHNFRFGNNKWMSHKLWTIRITSAKKSSKNLLCWKFARWMFLSAPLIKNLFFLRIFLLFVRDMLDICRQMRKCLFHKHPKDPNVPQNLNHEYGRIFILLNSLFSNWKLL